MTLDREMWESIWLLFVSVLALSLCQDGQDDIMLISTLKLELSRNTWYKWVTWLSMFEYPLCRCALWSFSVLLNGTESRFVQDKYYVFEIPILGTERSKIIYEINL
jgi:hypothetical protein